MEELYYLSATRLGQFIKEKKISCREAMTAYLARIEKIQPMINALTQRVPPEMCLKAADDADKLLAEGRCLGKLHGVPFAVKDILKAKGLISSAGNRGLFERGASYEDATLVARLKSAGAIMLGLTNVPELCRGGDSENLVYGQTNNPYDLSRTPGGSSGGSAALIAAGGAALAIGSDGGGSIMQPAHCTGIAGLKPSHGRFSNTGNATGDALGLLAPFIQYGPMARFVEDLELALIVLQGPDGIDPYAPPVSLIPVPLLKTLRIAYFTDNGISPVTQEIQSLVKEAAHSIKEDVAKVEEKRPLCIDKTFELHWSTFLGGDRGEGMKQYLKTLGRRPLSWELQVFMKQAEETHYSTAFLLDRLIEIDRYRSEMLAFMQDFDVLICPPFPVPAKPHGIVIKEIADFSYAMAFNLTGWPSVVVRCGTSSEGLPLGVLVAARRWEDLTALAIAKMLESNFGGWTAP